jgi:hypothetical protein
MNPAKTGFNHRLQLLNAFGIPLDSSMPNAV